MWSCNYTLYYCNTDAQGSRIKIVLSASIWITPGIWAHCSGRLTFAAAARIRINAGFSSASCCYPEHGCVYLVILISALSSPAHKRSNRNEGDVHGEHYLGLKQQCSFSAEAVSEGYGTEYRTELPMDWTTTVTSCYKRVMKWPARTSIIITQLLDVLLERRRIYFFFIFACLCSVLWDSHSSLFTMNDCLKTF